MTWPTVKLGEICTIVSGATPSTSVELNWNGDIYWATPKDLSKLNTKLINRTERRITEQGLKSCSANVLPVRSVLFSSRAPIGLVAINTVPMATNQGFKSLIVNPKKIDEDYLYWWLKTNRSLIDAMGVGATFKEVSKTIVEKIQLPLPPLAEQQRIAAILDKAEEIRRKREQAIAKLDELAQSTFVEMFGDPVTNNKNWPSSKLTNLLKIQGGFAFKSVDFVDKGIKLVKISNVHKDNLIWDDNERLPEQYIEKFDEFKLKNNDIVMALTRPIIKSQNSVKVAVVRDVDLPCLLNQRVARFLFCKDSKITHSYLLGLLKTKYFFDLVNKLCSVALQPNISTRQIENILIPLPPLHLQVKYDSFIKKISTQKNKFLATHSISSNLLISLQHQAFTTGFHA